MAVIWDDIEILRVIDESRRNNTGVAAGGMNLMQEIARRHEWQLDPNVDYGMFVRELMLARDAELLTYKEIWWGNFGPDPADPNMYLQRLQDIDITIAGRDRAEGREFRRPPPDPDEDDGRLIASLTLEQIARAVGDAYSGSQIERFLEDSGIPREMIPRFEGGEKWVDTHPLWMYVHAVFLGLAEGGAAQRRALRHFIGSWIDNRLQSGPDPDVREKVARDLARQGWFVREDRLVCGDPVYPTPQAEAALVRPARIKALHPRIVDVSRQLFEQGHRGGAILQAFTAVNNRVKELSERDDLDGVPLMSLVFRPEDPLILLGDSATETGRNIQSGYHRIFMGVIAAIRNPQAHGLFDHMDEDEAFEQLALASLLMRRLDEATTETGERTAGLVAQSASPATGG